MSRLPLESTPIGMNTTNRTTSPIDSIHVVTKTPDLTPLTQPTESPTQPTDYSKQIGKAHIPVDLESDPSWSDSSSSKSDLSNDSNYSESKSKKRNKKSVVNEQNRTRQTHC